MPTHILTLRELEQTVHHQPINEVEEALRRMWAHIQPLKRTDHNVLRRLRRACVQVGTLEALKEMTAEQLLSRGVAGGQLVHRMLLFWAPDRPSPGAKGAKTALLHHGQGSDFTTTERP